MIKKKHKKGRILLRLFMILNCLVLSIALGYSSYAIVTQYNFDLLHRGKLSISDAPVAPDREYVVIQVADKKKLNEDLHNLVIKSDINIIFESNDGSSCAPGSARYPIDLRIVDIRKGTTEEPLNVYINGNNNYFYVDLNWEQGKDGVFGVFSGVLANMNFVGKIADNPISVMLASVLEAEGELYNCNNYINFSSYDGQGFSAGFVGELKGNITKCTNYGNINANGFASGFAYKVFGNINNSNNCGKITSSSGQASGIAAEIIGSVENSNNYSNIEGKNGAAGIAVKVIGGSIIKCINGQPETRKTISSNSKYAAGIVYAIENYFDIESGINTESVVDECINNMNISGHISAGIAYNAQGKIINSVNNGNISSYSKSAGIVAIMEGVVENTVNNGDITGTNDCAAGITLEMSGDIINSQNTGKISTSGGHVAGIVYNINGNITLTVNSGNVIKSGWNSKAVGGIASKAKGKIEQCSNTGNITVQNAAIYIGGIAADMSGQIIMSKNSGKITQYNKYEKVTAGGIAAILRNINSPSIEQCEVTQDLYIDSKSKIWGIIAATYPKGKIINCIDPNGEEINL